MYHELPVVSVDRPIKGAVTIGIEIPRHLKADFRHLPGQHVGIRLDLDGTEFRRDYSVHSRPGEDRLLFTVKQVRTGTVSKFLNEGLQPGDVIDVSVPAGRFVLTPRSEQYRHCFFFAAGSGITPILCMMRGLLEGEPHSSVSLLFGNRTSSDGLFLEELDALTRQHPRRSTVEFAYSRPRTLSSADWTGQTGRIDSAMVERFIRNNPPAAQQTEYYICGPGGLNQLVRETLMGLGVPESLVHQEHFGVAPASGSSADLIGVRSEIAAKINGTHANAVAQPGDTILTALRAAGHEPPYSCESGVCARCVARVRSGRVDMRSSFALDEADIRAGLVLTCQSVPQTPKVELEYGSS